MSKANSGALGRVSGVRSPALPRMSSVLRATALPPLPKSQNWHSSIAAWPVLKNDEIGDCVIAAVGHMTQQESLYAGGMEILMTDDEAVSAYSELGGYVPGDPTTDRGLYEGDAGQHWISKGFKVGGQTDKIVGFADCDPKNLDELRYSILLTGNAMLAFSLPACADNTDLWTLPKNDEEAAIIGGHAVPAVGYDPDHLYIVTWGTVVPVEWPFIERYLLEVHTTLTNRWINGKGTTPAGVDWNSFVYLTRAFSHAVG